MVWTVDWPASKQLAAVWWFTANNAQPTLHCLLSQSNTIIYSLHGMVWYACIPVVYYQNGMLWCSMNCGMVALAGSWWFIAKMVPPPLTPILGHGHPLHPQVAPGIIETRGGLHFFIHVLRDICNTWKIISLQCWVSLVFLVFGVYLVCWVSLVTQVSWHTGSFYRRLFANDILEALGLDFSDASLRLIVGPIIVIIVK